ncbi:Ras GEF [Glarea lozoyensis ATCC 20868]|uniref:Ras GEF n=1 Tax=Glarea lozoyensis (strain ATCC 20868 / MF5171) TaxID=1116229 RepID=S3DSC4_GLAL2|nr:Ras GEF [Glarea lozoyensis ATCC 20868]EPE29313.1 Ras GEF [Glarea lozoyensis ATCC 20868]
MENGSPLQTTEPAGSRTEDLRQRQRDRLSPRGRFGKASRIATTVPDMEGSRKGGITLWPAPRAKGMGRTSPDLVRKKQWQEGLQKENSISRRTKRETEDGKLSEITPDGGSAGREGRQFTVANVGNNGRIYLRPTIRPANQRYPQPPFVFPVTPPSTAGLDALVTHHESDETPRDSLWNTPTRTPSTPLDKPRDNYFSATQSPTPVPVQPPRHKRARSYSTVDEQHVPVRDSDVGAFRVVIERPGDPKPPEAIMGIPTLEVPIPSYKLGTPRFSMRGTAFLRGSSYTTNDDMRASVFSHKDSSQSDPNSRRPTRILSRRHSDASHRPHFSITSPGATSPFNLLTPTSGVIRQRTPIVPEMFDTLTFKPSCDHPSVVRYSMSGGIRAATPARIVAEITSPTFVDYDLLSDFFLTFRSFLDTTDLLHMLIARLKWALAREDETGTVVRVRTFVAIRHWILNYFVDDYVVDYDLRVTFCELLNNFVNDPLFVHTKVPLKILGEIKKCWRRVCALYWDGPEFDTDLGSEVPITPGGVAGSRDPTLDPSFWDVQPNGPPQIQGIINQDFVKRESTSADGHKYFADVSRAGYLDSMMQPHVAPVISQTPSDDYQNPPLSPTSVVSEDFVSCSFPSRNRVGTSPQAGAHPVAASSIYDSAPPVALTPKALTGKRVRPTHVHKRSGSFSDSFRDHRTLEQPVQKVIYKSTELFLAHPHAGSLVRGNCLPPGQAFVEMVAPSTPSRDTTMFSAQPHLKGPSAMSGPGMKKLLGSVRRALSNRTGLGPIPSSSPTQGSFPHIPPLGVRGATINRLPGTAVVPQARSRNTGLRVPMRIDLLGAEIAEDFKKAVQEEQEAEAALKKAPSEAASHHVSGHSTSIQYPSMAPDATLEAPRSSRQDLVSDVTNGSKSIVIVDDTLASSIPAMTGALPTSSSIDDFSEPYVHRSGGPTPPTTPPDLPLGTPRRSSHLLGNHTAKRSLSLEDASFVPGWTLSQTQKRMPPPMQFERPSVLGPSRSFRSKKSVSLRRYASFHSGYTRHRSERSFDATTFSDSEARMSRDISHAPLPLRVLRRRPGGDLRAVTNVGDLTTQPLRRPMSTGSMTMYSDSVRSSYLLADVDSTAYVNVTSDDFEPSAPTGQTYSLGALAEAQPKQRISLFSTHSSHPIMRPSFEKEAQMLAQIPDDIDDDGGVESALLKLEGKYEQRKSDTSNSQFSGIGDRGDSFGARPLDVSTLALDDEEDEEEEQRRHRHEHTVEAGVQHLPSYYPQQSYGIEELKPSVYRPRGMDSYPAAMSPRSVESYNSTPLLERGLSEHGMVKRSTRNWSEQSIFRGPSTEKMAGNEHTPDSSHVNSFDFIDDSDSLRRIPVGHTMPQHQSMDHSFLNSESDDRSDLSSELSLEVISRIELTEQDSPSTTTFPPMRPGTVIKELALPSHPLRHPPSPPMTLTQALQLPPQSPRQPFRQERQPKQGPSSLPPTPEFTPTGQGYEEDYEVDRGATPTTDPLRSHMIPEPSRKTSVHLPFTLAFDSQILAQQFTLIEKDALNEIDWKDLIEMRWKYTTTDSRSWVDFLRSSEPRGVQVVIARFNLMVKWAISECVLTENLEERVRTVIKYIHIAAHCRKYRNFATMTQLTMALTTKDLSCLTRTWALIPEADRQTLKQLEELVTPTGNFHNLRAEMEGAGADQGCIPFVGIYTHDLLVNSERPSQIASTPTTEPLVNFERCRTDATIVKNLLRLLEASQLYRFLPIEGITERCLWMAALTDDEITRYAQAIQE